MKEISPKEPLRQTLTLPIKHSQKERYKRVSNQLSERKLTTLHTLVRERLDLLLDEVEEYLSKSS